MKDERHGIRYDKVIEVRLWASARYGRIKVQLYDCPERFYQYCYSPSDASINRLLRAIAGWNASYDSGIFKWRKPKITPDALRTHLTETRDLLRTGSPPEALNMTFEWWAEHRCNRAAAELTRLIEDIGG